MEVGFFEHGAWAIAQDALPRTSIFHCPASPPFLKLCQPVAVELRAESFIDVELEEFLGLYTEQSDDDKKKMSVML